MMNVRFFYDSVASGLSSIIDLESAFRYEMGFMKNDFYVNGCLCDEHSIDGLDIVIAHPHYDNDEGCWDRLRDKISKNPNIQFYVFSIGSIQREEVIGEHRNLTYVNSHDSADELKNILEDVGDGD